MGHVRFELEEKIHKELKQACIRLDYSQKELVPIFIKEGLERCKNKA